MTTAQITQKKPILVIGKDGTGKTTTGLRLILDEIAKLPESKVNVGTFSFISTGDTTTFQMKTLQRILNVPEIDDVYEFFNVRGIRGRILSMTGSAPEWSTGRLDGECSNAGLSYIFIDTISAFASGHDDGRALVKSISDTATEIDGMFVLSVHAFSPRISDNEMRIRDHGLSKVAGTVIEARPGPL